MQAIISSPSVSLALHVVREQRSPRVIREHDSHIVSCFCLCLALPFFHVVTCLCVCLARPASMFGLLVIPFRVRSHYVIDVCVFASRVPRACLVCVSYRSAFGAIMLFVFVFVSRVPRASLVCLFVFASRVPRATDRFNDEAVKPSPYSWAARRYADRYNLPGLHSMAECGGYQRSG